jgi:hypothetical protein
LIFKKIAKIAVGNLIPAYFSATKSKVLMASLIYNASGMLEDIRPGTADVAIYAGQQVPFITGSQLQRYAGIIYSESSFLGLARQINPANPSREMERECFAIAVTMYNYARAKGIAFQRANRVYGLNELLVDSGYTKGINSPKFTEYFSAGGDESKRRMATLAVIRLFMRQFWGFEDIIQSLQGAQYWDGNDLFRRFRDHYRAKKGFELSNPAHGRIYQNVTVIQGAQIISSCPAQEPAVARLRQYTFISTITLGGTIFFRLHPQATAQGITW